MGSHPYWSLCCAVAPTLSSAEFCFIFADVETAQVEFSNFGDKLVSSGGDFKVVIWSLEDFSILGIYDEAMAPVKRLGLRQAAINEIIALNITNKLFGRSRVLCGHQTTR